MTFDVEPISPHRVSSISISQAREGVYEVTMRHVCSVEYCPDEATNNLMMTTETLRVVFPLYSCANHDGALVRIGEAFVSAQVSPSLLNTVLDMRAAINAEEDT